jgi:mRNA interferase RelE/StbE
LPASEQPSAYVRLTEPAVDDLVGLARLDPNVARQALKKMILLERDPRAGEPLLGALIGFRKLTVGDRHWRVVWRVTADERGHDVVEIAEVWAAGARSDGDVYAEMNERVERLADTPETHALADVIHLLGRAAGAVTAAEQPTTEPVPDWLVDRLVHTAGANREDVIAMSPKAAMQAWEAFITKPPP